MEFFETKMTKIKIKNIIDDILPFVFIKIKIIGTISNDFYISCVISSPILEKKIIVFVEFPKADFIEKKKQNGNLSSRQWKWSNSRNQFNTNGNLSNRSQLFMSNEALAGYSIDKIE